MAANNKFFRLQYAIEGRVEYFAKMADIDHEGFEKKTVKAVAERKISDFLALLSKLKSVGFNYKEQRDFGTFIERDEIYDEIYGEVSRWPKKKEHFETECCLVQEREWFDTDLSAIFINQLGKSAKEAAIARINDRLWMQLNESKRAGWYMTFSTLTVSGDYYEKVFLTGSDMWRNYIRRIKRRCGAQCYGSWREAEKQNEDYFHFFAIVERGNQGRLHIHLLCFMKDVWFKKPTGRSRNIEDRNLLWPYGIDDHIAVRWSPNDMWAKKGFIWPNDEEDKPIMASNVDKIANYMLKYIMKSEKLKLTGEVESWKIRTNHRMGKVLLMSILERMDQGLLIALVIIQVYPIPIVVRGRMINSKLVRNLAVKEYLRREQQQKLERSVLRKNTTLVMLLNAMKRPKCSRSYASIGELTQKLFQNQAISDEWLERWYEGKSFIKERMK